MYSQITKTKSKQFRLDVDFLKPQVFNKSQLQTCRDYLLNKLDSFAFLGELGKNITWKKLKSSPILQNNLYLTEKDMEYIVSQYQAWVKINTCYGLQDPKTKELQLIRASKRGNSVYRKFLKIKLDTKLNDFEDPLVYKQLIKNVDGFREKKKVRVLFITLTIDPKKFHNNIASAWFNIESYYNNFATLFKQHYGEASMIKTVEAQENGYPHIHIFIISECRTKEQRKALNKKLKTIDESEGVTRSNLNRDFPKTPFNAFRHQKFNKETNRIDYSWRIKEKSTIAKMWKLGFSDVKVPVNFSKDCSYKDFIKDYMFKDMFKSIHHGFKSKRDLRSLAFGWLFGKKCFSISSCDLIENKSLSQIQQDEIKVLISEKKYIFLGFINISSKTSKPPPDFLTIKPTDPEYETVLKSICKPYRKPKTFLIPKPKPKKLFKSNIKTSPKLKPKTSPKPKLKTKPKSKSKQIRVRIRFLMNYGETKKGEILLSKEEDAEKYVKHEICEYVDDEKDRLQVYNEIYNKPKTS